MAVPLEYWVWLRCLGVFVDESCGAREQGRGCELLILGLEIDHRVGGSMADMALALDWRAVVVSLTEVGAALRTQVARA